MKITLPVFILVPSLLVGSKVVAGWSTKPARQQTVLGEIKAANPDLGAASSVAGSNIESTVQNANHIFNALHSSLRQWGSSLHHNGMSFFPASIPAHTFLYHGNHSPAPVKGIEWLAFEIEHAENFARLRRFRNGTGPGGPHGPGGGPPGPPPAEKKDGEEEEHGYLHTYRTTRPLRNILYVDGMSAGKTSMGTLDAQDYILRSNSGIPPPGSHPNTDWTRAKDLCALTKEWELEFEIEGIMRMEAGFELIMCDFQDGGLELVSVNQRLDPKTQQVNEEDQILHFEYVRGVAARYGGLGGGRVKVSYERMVSAFFYNVNLEISASKRDLPRLQNADREVLEVIKKAVRSMMIAQHQHELCLESEAGSCDVIGVDWQDVVDMIVSRYSDRLQFLAAAETTSSQFLLELNVLLNAFVDYAASEDERITSAIDLCQSHYLGPIYLLTSSDYLIHAAVSEVTGNICKVLFDSWRLVLAEQNMAEASRQSVGDWALGNAKEEIVGLIKWLDWSTWLECGKCAYHEVCYVAIWPWGAVEDHDSPSCLNSTMLLSRRGYWDSTH